MNNETVTNANRSEIFKSIREEAIRKCGKTQTVGNMLANLKTELAEETQQMFLPAIIKKYRGWIANNCSQATERGNGTWY